MEPISIEPRKGSELQSVRKLAVALAQSQNDFDSNLDRAYFNCDSSD